MVNRHTRRGKAEIAARAKQATPTPSAVRVEVRASGEFVFTIDTNSAPVPPRVYRAATVHADLGPDRVARFVFGQFRGLGRVRLHSAVIVEMTLASVQRILASVQGSPLAETLKAIDAGTMPPMPRSIIEGTEDPDQTMVYGAHLARAMVNPDLGGAIDFFELPVHTQPIADLVGVIRISCAITVVIAFVEQCRRIVGEQR